MVMAVRHLLRLGRVMNTATTNAASHAHHHHHRLIPITIAILGSPHPFNLCNPPPSSSYLSSYFPNSSHQRYESSIPNLASGGGGGTCIYNGAQNDDWIIRLAQFAVDKHNENEDAHLKFVRVVGASHTKFTSLLYHITFEAVDCGKQKVYHVVVWMQFWKNLMELLVWKPIHDALSAVGVKRGDSKLHEAVMFHMNHIKQDHYRI